jgi:hypothetical protein
MLGENSLVYYEAWACSQDIAKLDPFSASVAKANPLSTSFAVTDIFLFLKSDY